MASWRHPNAVADGAINFDYYRRLTEIAEDEEHNSEVKKTTDMARQIPQMDMHKILRLAVMGSAAASYHQFSKKMVDENNELTAELNRMKGVEPVNEGNPPADKSNKGKEYKEKDMGSYMDDLINDEVEAFQNK